MTKEYTISIEGLPEGWKAVAYREVKEGDYYLFAANRVCQKNKEHITGMYLIVEKIQLCFHYIQT